MSKVYIELNDAGVQELLKSPEMQAILSELAQGKVSQAGDGYSYEVHTGEKRAYCNIFPATPDAKKDNYANNTLERVIRS